METSEPTIRLYELAMADGRVASPYVWRIRYALAHKGLAFESKPLGFTEIPKVFNGRFKLVPVIEHGDQMLAESWDIVEYLDRAFPERPPIFSSPAENSTVRVLDAWFSAEIFKKIFAIYALDIHNAARPEDRPYFRSSREARLKGTTLEAYTANRESRLPELRMALNPLRTHLKRNAFLGGTSPNYADYMALGAFNWVACVSTLPLVAGDDEPIRAWLERSFDLYPGLCPGGTMKALLA